MAVIVDVIAPVAVIVAVNGNAPVDVIGTVDDPASFRQFNMGTPVNGADHAHGSVPVHVHGHDHGPDHVNGFLRCVLVI